MVRNRTAQFPISKLIHLCREVKLGVQLRAHTRYAIMLRVSLDRFHSSVTTSLPFTSTQVQLVRFEMISIQL
jgi:hypothetical protein